MASDSPKEGLVSRRRIHDGRVIRVDEDVVRFPNGSTGTLDVVRHPGASAVVPMLSDPSGADPSVLMIRQYRHAAAGWLLEIPAGRLDAGESPEACARRELREETGCEAERFEHLTTILTTPGFSDERIHLYLATGLTQGASHREPDEFIEPTVVTMSVALEQIRSGAISDAKTVVGLLYAAGFRGRV
jgi:ADP-ribose pyrophosphatase